ncbi:hypothetical protein [Paenibacillus lactis]|uniref:hypothetical protein n=1 Tax=Paenibacillus lactis TaxID=228574 RepID=UPI001BCCF741|nr:hypothetical protein [Paenibacillus lactis]
MRNFSLVLAESAPDASLKDVPFVGKTMTTSGRSWGSLRRRAKPAAPQHDSTTSPRRATGTRRRPYRSMSKACRTAA